MKTIVHSISGGKTSAYLAARFPADHIVFSLVCVDSGDILYPDSKLRQQVNDRLEAAGCLERFPEFTGTPEDPVIIQTILDLEQHIGKPITWVRGIGFDRLIQYKKALPNKYWRFCTSEMKLSPIFWWCYLNLDLHPLRIPPAKYCSKVDYHCLNPVHMGIGYRWDEAQRVDGLTTEFEITLRTLTTPNKTKKNSTFYRWRIPYTPLIEHEIGYFQVQEYFKDKPIRFAQDSNCQHCFYKPEQQIKHNLKQRPDILQWATGEEQQTNSTFKNGHPLTEILTLPDDPDFVYGGGSGCDSGMCVD